MNGPEQIVWKYSICSKIGYKFVAILLRVAFSAISIFRKGIEYLRFEGGRSATHVCSFFSTQKWLGLRLPFPSFCIRIVMYFLLSGSRLTIIMDRSPAFMVTKFLRKWSRNNWIWVESVFNPSTWIVGSRSVLVGNTNKEEITEICCGNDKNILCILRIFL